MGRDVEMQLVKILIHEKRPEQFINLQEKNGTGRSFQILIGMNEAYEIHKKVRGDKAVRPMTHDLCGALIKATGSKIERVVVSDLRKNTFYARIYLRLASGEVVDVDSRPSDAIALAVQLDAPIFVNEEVLDQLTGGM